MVKSLCYHWSTLDKRCQHEYIRATLDSLHVCDECTDAPAFATSKAFLQHRRIALGYNDPIVHHIDGSGICPSCHTSFGSRLRCLAHVTDSRRTKRRTFILENGWCKISPKELAVLEEVDRTARSLAQK